MFAFAPVSAFFGAPVSNATAKCATSITMSGKGFGGGEATRDPAPTSINPNDPKGKQKAIHRAESFAEYQARMRGQSAGAPRQTSYSPPRQQPSYSAPRQQPSYSAPPARASPSKAPGREPESFAEYQARMRGGSAAARPQSSPAAPRPSARAGAGATPRAPESFAEYQARMRGQSAGASPGYAPPRSSQPAYSPPRGAPAAPSHGGKGFGGGEATRDPAPTRINPNDPKGKQKAIHNAESFAEYQARMAKKGTTPPPAAKKDDRKVETFAEYQARMRV